MMEIEPEFRCQGAQQSKLVEVESQVSYIWDSLSGVNFYGGLPSELGQGNAIVNFVENLRECG